MAEQLAATIQIYADRSWKMEFAENADDILRSACRANMENNWSDELEYFDDDAEEYL